MPRPRPVTTERVCSECELDWEMHPDNPTLSDCIKLLKSSAQSAPYPVCALPHYPVCNRRHYPDYQIWWSNSDGGTSVPQLPYSNYTIQYG